MEAGESVRDHHSLLRYHWPWCPRHGGRQTDLWSAAHQCHGKEVNLRIPMEKMVLCIEEKLIVLAPMLSVSGLGLTLMTTWPQVQTVDI